MLLYQLLRPLAYMMIKDESKWKIDLLLPLLFAIVVASGVSVLPSRPIIFGSNGLLTLFIGLFQILPGFYLTALAAVATFNRPDMDQLMPKPSPRINISRYGQPMTIELTRRRMLSMLFGYLTFISFSLYFLSVFSQGLSQSIHDTVPLLYHHLIVNIFLYIFFLLLGQLVTITMFGLYQLSERMHQPD